VRPEPSKIVPVVLRSGAIVVFVAAQLQSKLPPGLTGPRLTITFLTSAIVVMLLITQLAMALGTFDGGTPRTPKPRAPSHLPPHPEPVAVPRDHPPSHVSPPDKPSLVLPADQLSRVPPDNQPSPVRLDDQPSRVPPDNQPSPVPPDNHQSRLPPADQLSRVPRGNQPSRVPLDDQPSSAPPNHQPSHPLTDDTPSGLSRIMAKSRRAVVALTSRAPVTPTMAIALAMAVALSVALDAVVNGGPALAVLLYSLGIAAIRLPLRYSAPIGLLAIAGLLVEGAASGRVDRDLSLMLTVCLVYVVSYSVRERRATRAAEAREAVLAERARIAREIHDILAHSLSAQLVHLEGAKLLLRAHKTDEALDRVVRARDLAKSGLEEASRAVSALREDPSALPDALRTLAKEFEAITGRPCALHISGAEHRLPPETELALLRTAQEALTNVRRHAPGSPATVRLRYEPGACDLNITNPAGTAQGTSGGGYGLVGMRERAELLGGTLSAGETDTGFQVHLRVPA
jgi:signal transduction histidine kinase